VFVVPPGRDLEPSTSIRMMAKKEKKKNNKGDGVVVSRQEILRRKTDPLIHRENRRVADRLRATYTRPSSSSSSSIQQGGGSSSSSRGLQRRATAAGLVYGESSRRERLEAAATKAATLDAGHAIGSSGIPKGLGLCVRCVACGMESDQQQQQQQQQQGVSGSEEEVEGIVVPFRPCPLCERVWYCDETCRGVDWALSHRRQCDGVSSKTKTLRGDDEHKATFNVCLYIVTLELKLLSSNPLLSCHVVPFLILFFSFLRRSDHCLGCAHFLLDRRQTLRRGQVRWKNPARRR
jgi:hypothetical protein